MIKSTLSFILLLFVSSQVFAQIGPNEVPIVAYWSKGDTLNYQMTKISIQKKLGQTTKVDSSLTDVKIIVFDSTEFMYRLKWRSQTDLSQMGIPKEMMDELKEFTQFDIVYKTDEFGSFLEVENWEEIAEKMETLLEMVIESSPSNIDKESLKKRMQPLLSAFTSKEGVEQLLCKEIHFLHFAFGYAYDTLVKQEFTQQLPNVFSGGYLNSTGTQWVENINLQDYTLELRENSVIDEKDTKELILDMLSRLKIPKSNIKKEYKKSKIELNDQRYLKIDFRRGVPIYTSTSREIKVKLPNQDAEKIDIVKFQLVK